MPLATHVDRATRTATVRVSGDIVVATAPAVYGQLRALARRRDVRSVVVDFADAGRVDSSGIATVSLVSRQLARSGKALRFEHLGEVHRAVLDLLEEATTPQTPVEAEPPWLERLGASLISVADAFRALLALIGDVFRQLAMVVTGRKKLPRDSLVEQSAKIGVGALGIVALLAALLGATIAFQGVVQLGRFGAGAFVADMLGVAMVREFGPLITAIILTGRTGAAIAAELGTMRVGSEIDALATMGVSPTRFLLLPRLLALTFVQPALTLIAMFVGIFGGLVVVSLSLHLPVALLWGRVVQQVMLGDFLHGLLKSVIFAWIIGFAGCHLGMRVHADATSVGSATTRTVVAGIFGIILVDALAATLASLGGSR